MKEKMLDMQETIAQWRRYFHQYPGVGFDVEETSTRIEQELDKMGITNRKRFASTGIAALIEGNSGCDKTVALRADIDGLPIQQINDVPYKSKIDGRMHACGHDAHIAMALGVAKYFTEHKEELDGNLLLIFQPGEEGYGGAQAMLDDGLYEEYPFETVFGCHVGSIFPDVKYNKIGLSAKPTMAAAVEFSLDIYGKGGHGAVPQETVDPVVVSAHVITALQTIKSRRLAPTDNAIVTIGEIKGGSAPNIIPDKVTLRGTARYLTDDIGKCIYSSIDEIAKGVTAAFGGRHNLTFKDPYPPVKNDDELVKWAKEELSEVTESDQIVEIEKPSMGGEDVAVFLRKAPGIFFFLGTNNNTEKTSYPHHHHKFDIDDSLLWKGTNVFVNLIKKYYKR
ncbi:M20 family metallopeptidase [Proteinivorax hydrogeniformans]|uniref:M20 family metallopeptidase n=1 Tax=Proteinivorax hydrogeniformans TaxID=1826727 RepID=A0AAU8HUY0_9FIRM